MPARVWTYKCQRSTDCAKWEGLAKASHFEVNHVHGECYCTNCLVPIAPTYHYGVRFLGCSQPIRQEQARVNANALAAHLNS